MSNHQKSQVAQHAPTKSFVYQSFYAIIKSNNRLIDPICSFLNTQINKYICFTEDKQAYFNLRLCFNFATNDKMFKLMEPLDVLFHCADLCSLRSLTIINRGVQSLSLTTLNTMRAKFDSVIRTFHEKDARTINTLYTKDLSHILLNIKVREQISNTRGPVAEVEFMRNVHQIMLGMVDAICENSVNNDFFDKILPLIEKYEQFSQITSQEIEKLIVKNVPETAHSNSSKRKLNNNAKEDAENRATSTPAAKKTRKNQENIRPSSTSESTRPAQITTRRRALGDITNITQKDNIKFETVNKDPERFDWTEVGESKKNITENFSPTILSFSHENRITFKCVLKLIQLYLGSTDSAILSFRKTLNIRVLNTIVNLITNEKFAEYIMKLAENKLKSLNEYLNKSSSSTLQMSIYDPRFYDDENILDFLTSLWA